MPITEAIAYLKYDDPTIETSKTITVAESQFPAHLTYDNGLTCYYLLDKGDSFEYVQNGHLLEYAETVESLHSHAVANLERLASTHLVVAAIPARDIRAFFDSKSSEGIAQLLETISRAWTGGDHLLTKQLFRRAGRSWEVNDT